MSREPSYPADAKVGTGESPQEAPTDAQRRNKKIVKGAAIGIGSAAIVAALLYANRSKDKNKR
jgi:hypothetical protein